MANARCMSAAQFQRTGKPEQAREHLVTATPMYREMDRPKALGGGCGA